MKGSNEKSLGEAIREMLEHFRLQDKVDETALIDSWESVVGPMVSKYTKEIFIRKRKLFVRIDSPAVKNELLYLKGDLLKAINKHPDHPIIDEIVIL
jgi:predicted nucleic acid-binding Zn ribbon protein